MTKAETNEITTTKIQCSLLFGLWQPMIPPAHMSTYAPIQTSRYRELDHFRRKVYDNGDCPSQRPYDTFKAQANVYRLIFFGLGTVFAILSLLIYMKNPSSFCSLHFNHCDFAKNCLLALCMVSTSIAYCITGFIRPEKEATQLLMKRAMECLDRAYQQKRLEAGDSFFSSYNGFSSCYHQLRHSYRNSKEKLWESYTISMQLLRQIARSKQVKAKEKEILFNQALLELNEKLNGIIQGFYVSIR